MGLGDGIFGRQGGPALTRGDDAIRYPCNQILYKDISINVLVNGSIFSGSLS